MRWTLLPRNISTKISLLSAAGCLFTGIAALLVAGLLVTRELEAQAQTRQNSNMAVAWEVLRHQGHDFRLDDGKIFAGPVALNGNSAVVDRVKALVGGTTTVFMAVPEGGGTEFVRVATNVMKPDGSRAVGTR
ncbi:MAG: Cache 3/Cache 2 fusion domain-containing protein, partial [Rhodospirillales bacterium]|nr:Cache 3/Cache 2 fusion domain-containing protein [Rhodospirillales bacterium]